MAFCKTLISLRQDLELDVSVELSKVLKITMVFRNTLLSFMLLY